MSTQLNPQEVTAVKKIITGLLEQRKSWPRAVSCGFLASEIHRVGFYDVMIDCYRFYNLKDLNRRELEECLQWCEQQSTS